MTEICSIPLGLIGDHNMHDKRNSDLHWIANAVDHPLLSMHARMCRVKLIAMTRSGALIQKVQIPPSFGLWDRDFFHQAGESVF